MAKPVELSGRTALERVASGDAAAVREVVAMYGDLLWSVARRFTGSDADAEEAVQDIFVLLWRKADRYNRALGSEKTFVMVLARRALIERWRRASRRPALRDMEDAAARDALATPAERDEAVDAVSEAFSELDGELQSLLRLSITRGSSHAEIAEITGQPLGTVKTRIRRAMLQLRERIGRGPLSGATP